MSSNTELEGDGMEVQAHEGAHKHVEHLLEATGELSNCFVKNVVEAGQNLRVGIRVIIHKMFNGGVLNKMTCRYMKWRQKLKFKWENFIGYPCKLTTCFYINGGLLFTA